MEESIRKPIITTPSISGAVCNFKSAFAGLPLKSHTVDIDSVSGVSAINIGSDAKYADFITWNQLYTHASIPSDSVIKNVTTYTINGITWEKNDDNSFTVYTEPTGATADSAVKIANGLGDIGSAIYSNYHIVGATGISGKARIYYSNRNIENTDYGCFNPLGSGFNMWLGVRAGEIITEPIRVYPQIYNISLMFGATKAQEIYSSGSGVIYFRGLFPLNHYEYTVGSISTVSAVNGSTNSFFTIPIGQTVNEGVYNAKTGVLEVTQPSVQTLQLPPCPIDTLEVNNIWADTGDTTLQYIKLG